MENKRECFNSDEDGHWYLINVEDKKLFEEMLADHKQWCEKHGYTEEEFWKTLKEMGEKYGSHKG